MEQSHDRTPPILTEQEMRNVAAYVDMLKRIHVRLMIEGYEIVDGEIVHPRQQDETEPQS
jgi:hypothetical protein